jgi:hypothetical protein
MEAAGTVFAPTGSLPALLLAALTGTVSTDVVESGPFTSLEQTMLPNVAAEGETTRLFGFYNTIATLTGSLGALLALAGSSPTSPRTSSSRPSHSHPTSQPRSNSSSAAPLTDRRPNARQAYVVAHVDPGERTAAAAYTNTARNLSRPLAPVLAGIALRAGLGLPFVFAGTLKSAYDLSFCASFRGRLARPAIAGRTEGRPSGRILPS